MQVRTLGGPLPRRMFAKIWIDGAGQRQYEPISEIDLASFARAVTSLESTQVSWPRVRIAPGHNTNQILNYGYTHWHQMFNERQLLVLSELGHAIASLTDAATRDVLLCAYSGLLEFNNMFASFKGEGSGAVRPLFSHHILKPERVPFETNPLSTAGSGTFPGLFARRVLRVIDYARDPFELRLSDGTSHHIERVGGLSEPLGVESVGSGKEFENGAQLYLSAGDSGKTDVTTETVDVVVTDPPFFDNVNYSELADFFWVWQRHLSADQRRDQPESTRSPVEVQHQDEGEFGRRLERVWTECHRVLRRRGLLVFTYHHSRSEGWQSLLESLIRSGFVIMACQPVKSELSVATPKAQARHPIDLDVIVVCRKRELTVSTAPDSLDSVSDDVVAAVRRQVRRFRRTGRILRQNDIRTLVTAQILRWLSSGLSLSVATTRFMEAQEFIDDTVDDILKWQARLPQRSDNAIGDEQLTLL